MRVNTLSAKKPRTKIAPGLGEIKSNKNLKAGLSKSLVEVGIHPAISS